MVSSEEFLAAWRAAAHLLTPSAADFDRFYGRDSPLLSGRAEESADWDLLRNFLDEAETGGAALHPLLFRLHLPGGRGRLDEQRPLSLLLRLHQSLAPPGRLKSAASSSAPAEAAGYSLEAVTGRWNELHCELLGRWDALSEAVHQRYRGRLYDNPAAFDPPAPLPAPTSEEDKKAAPPLTAWQELAAELEELDEELLVTAAALSLLWAHFFCTAAKGARLLVDELTLPAACRTIQAVPGAAPDGLETFEWRGLHFQLPDSAAMLADSEVGADHRAAFLSRQEKTLLQTAELLHKILGREFRAFQSLNAAAQALQLREDLRRRYFDLPAPAPAEAALFADGDRFVSKFSTLVDVAGFRLLVFAPNQSPDAPAEAAARPLTVADPLLGRLAGELGVHLGDGAVSSVELSLAALPSASEAADSATLQTTRPTARYLAAKLLLPADLAPLGGNEPLHKHFRPEFLRLFAETRGPSEGPLAVLSARELLDCYGRNLEVDGLLRPREADQAEEEAASQSLPFPPASLRQWRELCGHYYTRHLPAVAAALDNYEAVPVDSASLRTALHARGVNLRHLGLLHGLSQNLLLRQLLLAEMIARAVKTLLRQLTASFLLGHRSEALLAERRGKAGPRDFQELSETVGLGRQQLVLEVFNVLFPTRRPAPAPGPAQGPAASKSAASSAFRHFQRLEQVAHFYEALAELLLSKFGLQLALPQRKAAASAGGLEDGLPADFENPLAALSLHPQQLFHSLCFHLQVRFKAAVLERPPAQAAAQPASSLSPASASLSHVFAAVGSFAKLRDLTLLDLVEQAVPKTKLAWPGPLEVSHYLGRFQSFFEAEAADWPGECQRLTALRFSLENSFFLEAVLAASPNDVAAQQAALGNLFRLAWAAYRDGRLAESYGLVQRLFLRRSTGLLEYSLAGLPLFLLLMLLEYRHARHFGRANLCYDAAAELIGKLLPFGHPLATLPMMLLADLFLSYPALDGPDPIASAEERRRESLRYGRFFLQMALAVWRHTLDPAQTGPAAASPSSPSSSSPAPGLAGQADSFLLARLSRRLVVPVAVLQAKLARLSVELEDFDEAVPLLLGLTRLLETLLASLLAGNFTLSPALAADAQAASRARAETLARVLRLFVPALYQLAVCQFRGQDFPAALLTFQKLYQLFNKVTLLPSSASPNPNLLTLPGDLQPVAGAGGRADGRADAPAAALGPALPLRALPRPQRRGAGT